MYKVNTIQIGLTTLRLSSERVSILPSRARLLQPRVRRRLRHLCAPKIASSYVLTHQLEVVEQLTFVLR